MSSNQQTMVTSIAAAGKTSQATKDAAVTTHLTTIAAAASVAGYKPGDPTGNATYVAAVKSAASALADSRALADMTRIAAINVAKDLLRSQGEIPW
jgi:hypothetical protein